MPEQPVTYYAVTRERGENWDATLSMRQQENWDEHAVFMQESFVCDMIWWMGKYL